ncbi:MAG TPA: DUF2203 domain-containing protein [Polyangiaceae bacterium]|nr:DUF2203 domain-containing protein [Polyangiaceae bacterium]
MFTIEEVNGLIPSLSKLVEKQLLLQSEIEQQLAELSRLRPNGDRSLAVDDEDTADTRRLKGEVEAKIRRYEAGWHEVQRMGAVVKDPRIGLLDFYGHVEGRLVWLCWRYGEDSLGYYHELDAGYAGRRPLQGAVYERLLN